MSDHLAFQLSDVGRLLRRRFDERARAIGVTRPQWRVLVTLVRHEGATQGALAELLEVEPITLCRMIDRLAEAALVERRRDPGDRRAWNIFLTERAHPLIVRLRAVADELLEAALTGFDAERRAALADDLTRLRANLNSMPKEHIAHG